MLSVKISKVVCFDIGQNIKRKAMERELDAEEDSSQKQRRNGGTANNKQRLD